MHTEIGKTFIHTETGKEVQTLEWIRVKMKTEWEEVIVYEHDGKKFARPWSEFEARFTLKN